MSQDSQFISCIGSPEWHGCTEGRSRHPYPAWLWPLPRPIPVRHENSTKGTHSFDDVALYCVATRRFLNP